ncbi:AraC family transcriptional regulator [Rhizobium sp. 18055]|uniref:helix-turn-helix domain-containing protein n=1 Tax=Rhizobium sp. 18055 TaxID=2681403 RepID=UPI001356C607|nr:AraC family transcriptional regulator [Rhizobium sp. 18055]
MASGATLTNFTGGAPFRNDADHWQRFPVREIEDLRNMVLGADLEPVQMIGRKVDGSLAFSARDGVVFSSGHLDGSATARGVVSRDAATVGVVLSQGDKSRISLHRVFDGVVGVILPGDRLDLLMAQGALYVTATLDLERLEVVVARKFLQSAIHPKPLEQQSLDELTSALLRIHAGEGSVAGIDIGKAVLRAAASHYVNDDGLDDRCSPSTYEVIVRLARNYIERHLAQPITTDDLTIACGTSPRTLYRAFLDTLGEAPVHYIRRLRLHRIRQELRSVDEPATVSASARKWGISEHGRMSGWYHDVFGEVPSATKAIRDKKQLSQPWL